ncbi:GntR family transcriptional regulator [Actinoplanes sp. Pm04-4]|uniref:GntR family transcriptional regulator n=1 Tax=Paractinoplanes pyxinae TaxID=2997416 RepID=A0ABT4AV85_9ACTN|nr:GntR family transcriptional regulator [Actinoplanes pyxinae]MCY1138155.1 GntR family transcriptional regulator [Actinoplanes pyxinae]
MGAVEEVAAELRGRIMAGELRPGTRVRLEEVAGRLGLSITPVREALLVLRGEDMVELEPNRGYVVAPLSRQDVGDLFQIQAGIAGEMAARVAARITAAGLDELVAADRALGRARRPAEIEQREHEFHRLVNRQADSRKLHWFLHPATRSAPPPAEPPDRDGLRRAHKELLAAFAARDTEAARALTIRHLTEDADRRLRALDELGVWAVERRRRGSGREQAGQTGAG